MILPCFIITCLALCTNGLKLHDHMTKEEIQSTFNVDHHLVDGIEYEVASLHHVEQPGGRGQKVRRSRSTVQFTAFDKSISLDLLETGNTLLGSATPLYIATGGPYNIQYERRTFPIPNNLKLYHDVKKRAAITVFTDENNTTHVSGTIGDEYTIRPIPARLQKRMIQGEIPLDQGTLELLSQVCTRANLNDSEIRTRYMNHDTYKHCYDPNLHFVVKTGPQVNSPTYPTGPSFNNPSSNQRPTWRPILNTQQQPWSGVPNSQGPAVHQTVNTQRSDIMYPQILVTVDYKTFENHGRDINKLSNYMAAFWNSVDLRFRELSQPQVRLNIAGLVVPQTKDDAPYFELGVIDDKTLNSDKTLNGMEKTISRDTQFFNGAYDVTVGMTHRDLKQQQIGGNFIDVNGVAKQGRACQQDGFGLLKDKGGFIGVSTAAHELGHSFNAVHDGVDTKNYPGGPCPLEDGYLMSSLRKDYRGVHWSRCSIRAMKEFFTSSDAQCMKNKPDVGTPYPKILPGKIVSRDRQCAKAYNNDAFFSAKDHESNCEVLWCKEEGTPWARPFFRTPADGSPCGPRSICLDAKCVLDPTL